MLGLPTDGNQVADPTSDAWIVNSGFDLQDVDWPYLVIAAVLALVALLWRQAARFQQDTEGLVWTRVAPPAVRRDRRDERLCRDELLADLHAAGIEVPAIIDSRTTASAMAESVARDMPTAATMPDVPRLGELSDEELKVVELVRAAY